MCQRRATKIRNAQHSEKMRKTYIYIYIYICFLGTLILACETRVNDVRRICQWRVSILSGYEIQVE